MGLFSKKDTYLISATISACPFKSEREVLKALRKLSPSISKEDAVNFVVRLREAYAEEHGRCATIVFQSPNMEAKVNESVLTVRGEEATRLTPKDWNSNKTWENSEYNDEEKTLINLSRNFLKQQCVISTAIKESRFFTKKDLFEVVMYPRFYFEHC